MAANANCKKTNCKWCAKSECWDKGQIEKPADYQPKKRKGNAGNSSAANPKDAIMKMMQKHAGNKGEMMKTLMTMMMGGAAGGGADGQNAKQMLIEKLSKDNGKAAKIGEDISYDTNEVASESKRPEYQSTVTINGQSFAGEIAISKKAAEQNAATSALNELYPGSFQAQAGKAKKGQKRKTPFEELSPQVQLSRLITEQKGSPISKDDIARNVEASEGGFTATISIPSLNATFSGAGASRKEAEAAAFEAAVSNKKIKTQIDAAEATRVARKKAKDEASMAKFKEKHPQHFEKKPKLE